MTRDPATGSIAYLRGFRKQNLLSLTSFLVLIWNPLLSTAFCIDSVRLFSLSGNRYQNHASSSYLSAKSNNRKKNKKAKKNATVKQPKNDDALELTPIQSATQRRPASVAGVEEDHNYEQFFYDDSTCRQLYQVADQYERPLLLCNPSLAVLAEKYDRPYLLLDRDDRFHFLSGYQRFSLTEPFLITSYNYDAVFVDPPFANVTPQQLVTCLQRMASNQGQASVPVYVAYNSRREDSLRKAFDELPCPPLERLWNLGYQEGVSEETQDSIWLYGPSRIQKYSS